VQGGRPAVALGAPRRYDRTMLASALRRSPGLDDAEDPALAEALAPAPLDDARESLEFWRARLSRAPRYRFRRRREAREMIGRWEARVRRAEIAAFGGGLTGRLWAAWDRGSWRAVRGELASIATRRVRLPAVRAVVLAAAAVWMTTTLALAVFLAALLGGH